MGRVSQAQGEITAVSSTNLEVPNLVASGSHTEMIGSQKISQATAFLLAG